MVDQVVVRQRLLDHRQLELIDLLEQRQILQGVATVAVDMDRVGRMLLADRAEHVEIPARSELELHAGKSIRHRLADIREQLIDRIEYAEVGSDRNFITGRAEQFMQRLIGLAGGERPEGIIENCFGKRIAFEQFQGFLDILSRVEFASQESGSEPIASYGK